MDQQLVAQKLESLRRCVSRITSKLPKSVQALNTDVDAQDIIALNLTRAIQICVDVGAHWLSENSTGDAPKTMGQVFSTLAEQDVISEELATRLRKPVGFRNVVVHNYDAVNWSSSDQI